MFETAVVNEPSVFEPLNSTVHVVSKYPREGQNYLLKIGACLDWVSRLCQKSDCCIEIVNWGFSNTSASVPVIFTWGRDKTQ